MKEIKIGRRVFEIKPGDYVMYNGACYQFFAGDRRTLYHKNWVNYPNITIPKTWLKEIPFDKMRKETRKDDMIKDYLTYWFFE
jgi:hypothetical protein